MPKEKELNATLPQSQWMLISEALSNMPYGKVSQLITEINRQFSEQLKTDENDVPKSS